MTSGDGEREGAGAEEAASFIWRDGGRTVVLRHGGLGAAVEVLAENGFASFELLASERALSETPGLATAADAVHAVGPGSVPELAGPLVDGLGRAPLVALGGGRVIDTAKAVASVTGAPVAAIPTTLSGAEMTGIHRPPAGAEGRVAGLVRPGFALADPEAMTSLPEPALRASAMNALAHGADSLYTPFANPVSTMSALQGAELIAAALEVRRERRDRAALATGSLLCGYAIDSGLFGLHHVVCQTLVRVCGTPHAETNAAILPEAMAFIASRAPEQIGALATAIGAERAAIGAKIRKLGDHPAGLGALGADRSKLGVALDAMLDRSELGFTPGAPNRAQLTELIDRAW